MVLSNQGYRYLDTDKQRDIIRDPLFQVFEITWEKWFLFCDIYV